MNAEKLKALALQYGAKGAQIIPGEKIVLDPQFREICRRNSCGRYGRCHMCPPDLGEMEDLMAKVRAYPKALVYQSVWPLEDSFDFESMMEGGAGHQKLSTKLQRAAKELLEVPFLHLSSGCRLCERCAKLDDSPCRHPEEALGAVEGYCINVSSTIKGTDLKYVNGENTVTYFGMILFVE